MTTTTTHLSTFEAIRAGIAPRLAKGWEAALAALEGGDFMSHPILILVIVDTGLAASTAANLLREAVKEGLLERQTTRSGHQTRYFRGAGYRTTCQRRHFYRLPQ